MDESSVVEKSSAFLGMVLHKKGYTYAHKKVLRPITAIELENCEFPSMHKMHTYSVEASSNVEEMRGNLRKEGLNLKLIDDCLLHPQVTAQLNGGHQQISNFQSQNQKMSKVEYEFCFYPIKLYRPNLVQLSFREEPIKYLKDIDSLLEDGKDDMAKQKVSEFFNDFGTHVCMQEIYYGGFFLKMITYGQSNQNQCTENEVTQSCGCLSGLFAIFVQFLKSCFRKRKEENNKMLSGNETIDFTIGCTEVGSKSNWMKQMQNDPTLWRKLDFREPDLDQCKSILDLIRDVSNVNGTVPDRVLNLLRGNLP